MFKIPLLLFFEIEGFKLQRVKIVSVLKKIEILVY